MTTQQKKHSLNPHKAYVWSQARREDCGARRLRIPCPVDSHEDIDWFLRYGEGETPEMMKYLRYER